MTKLMYNYQIGVDTTEWVSGCVVASLRARLANHSAHRELVT